MKYRWSNIALVIIFFIYYYSNAQITFSNVNEGGIISFTTKQKEADTKLLGSPCLEENFKFGQVFIKDKKTAR